jgi:O-antigen/teichoic acid export membrane protein
VFSIAFVIIGLVADPLSRWLNISVLRDSFWTLASYVVVLLLTIACDCYLTARQDVKAAAIFAVIGESAVSVICLAVAFWTRQLNAILVGMVVSRALQLLVMTLYIHHHHRGFQAERYFFGIREQIRYGIILGAGGTLITMLLRMHEFFVSRYYGAEVFGVYSAGCTDLPLIRIFIQSISVVALGRFAQLEQQNDWEGIRRLWRRTLVGSYAVAIPVVVLLLLVSKPLVLFVFTDTYADAVPIFRINTLAKLGLVFNYTLILRAMDRNGITLWINAVALALAPLMLYGGMKVGGLGGIITVNALFMIGTRLAGTAIMNRIVPTPMPYMVSPRELIDFYRESYGKLRTAISKRRGKGGKGLV